MKMDGVGGDRLPKGCGHNDNETGRPNFFSQGSLWPKLPTAIQYQAMFRPGAGVCAVLEIDG